MTFQIKQHDTRIALKAVLESESGPVNLTDATVRFLMSDYGQSQVLIDSISDIIDANTGEVWHVFDYGETDKPGIYKAEFEVTFSDGRLETFPTQGYITIEIIRDLG